MEGKLNTFNALIIGHGDNGEEDRGGEIIKITHDGISIEAMIEYLQNYTDTKILNVSEVELDGLLYVNGILSDEIKEKIKTLNLNFDSYVVALSKEDYMRDNMYKKGFENHPMNTDPYYNLIKFTDIPSEIYDMNRKMIQSLRKKTGLLFNPTQNKNYYNTHDKTGNKINWSNIITFPPVDDKYKKYVFVAGGEVFGKLTNNKSSDIDIFIHSCTLDVMKDIIYNMCKTIPKISEIIRTANAITIKTRPRYNVVIEYQIILRLYKSPSEIIHGFDVDCCSIGFDGTNIWMTQRAKFALTNGYNTVNFNRLSPSYEYRLSKYGTRGMGILIPNFKMSKVDTYKLKKTDLNTRYKGLDTLLVTNHKWVASGSKLGKNKDTGDKTMTKRSVKSAINKKSDETSDYDTKTTTKFNNSAKVHNIIRFVNDYNEDHPKNKRKYKKFGDNMKTFNKDHQDEYLSLYVNGLVKTRSFYFIKLMVYTSVNAEDLELLFNISEDLYDIFKLVKGWSFSRKLEIKTHNPGDQMTNTFHSTVLDDNNKWYEGEFYNTSKM